MVLLLWIFYVFCFVLCLLCLCGRLFICALWSTAGKGLTSWLSFVVSNCELSFSHWYPWSGVVLVSIPDLCTLTYFYKLEVVSKLSSLIVINILDVINSLHHWSVYLTKLLHL